MPSAGKLFVTRLVRALSDSSVVTAITNLVAAQTTAVQIDFTPDGDIAATNVQAAVVEVRDDAAAALSPVTARVNQSESVAAVKSTDYQILVTDGYVPFNTDAARAPILPQAAGFQMGADITVADQAGTGGASFTITVNPFAGDSIIGTATITTDRGVKRFKKVAATTWMVV